MAEKIIHLGIPKSVVAKGKDLAADNFPSMFGPAPVWVFSKPKADFVNCENCKQPMTFLMQVYAPIDDYEYSYHRMLYVFGCTNKACARSGKEIKVLRCQSSEIGAKLLPPEPNATCKPKPKGKDKGKLAEYYVLDVVSEDSAITAAYASKMSQILHKQCYPFEKIDAAHCVEESKIKSEIDPDDVLADFGEGGSSASLEYETQLWKQYLEKEKEKTATSQSSAEAELEQLETEMIEKMQFEKEKEDVLSRDEGFELFQAVSNKNPKQVLRYALHFHGVEPLWYQVKGLKKLCAGLRKNTCRKCGGKLVFEMQIMPQLFNYLKATLSVDWGVIVIFTYCF